MGQEKWERGEPSPDCDVAEEAVAIGEGDSERHGFDRWWCRREFVVAIEDVEVVEAAEGAVGAVVLGHEERCKNPCFWLAHDIVVLYYHKSVRYCVDKELGRKSLPTVAV